MSVFTEGLDETEIRWVRQGSEIESRQQQRSPVTTPEKLERKFSLLDPVYRPRSGSFFPPKLQLRSEYSSSIHVSEEKEVESGGSVSFASHDESAYREEEIVSSDSYVSSFNSVNAPVGKSKENLHVTNYPLDDYALPSVPPSAPPILGNGDGLYSLDRDEMEAQEEKKLVPAQITSVQNAWESMVAYEACNRFCMNAYNRGHFEAFEFVRDDFFILRRAFRLQKHLLQPKGENICDTNDNHEKEPPPCVKGRKNIEKLEVEVKKVQIISHQPKLRRINSLRSIYAQVGYGCVKKMTKLLKNQISQIKCCSSFHSAASSTPLEESHECLLSLKSDSRSSIMLYTGSGETHCFYPENNGDEISLEIHNYNGTVIWRTTIPLSSLPDINGQIVIWQPISLDDFSCVGRVQLSFNVFISENTEFSKMVQGAPPVETQTYDTVLETAMRVQNFNAKNLQIKEPWNWLLNEFSTFYDVSEWYKTLRYLSHVMQVAVPTKGCLDLVHDLLVPVLNAHTEQKLTGQEKNILIDCEEKTKKLLAKTFKNYKSLDEFSLTGLTEGFAQSQIVDQPVHALLPAVKLFSLLHDILSPHAQDLLRQYLHNANERRYRSHMLETEEFALCDTLLTDTISASNAYLKMKNLCLILGKEIEADIKINDQNIFPSSVDALKIAASVYSLAMSKKIKRFLTACPPSRPFPHVLELLISAVDFEKDLINWNLRSVNGLVAREIFDGYVVNWIEDTRLHLLDICKTQLPYMDVAPVSPFVHIYEQIRESINEYEVVIKRWPQYLVLLETVVADVERRLIILLEKQFKECLAPLRKGIKKTLENNVKKIGNILNVVCNPNLEKGTSSTYIVSSQLGTFMNTLERMKDESHEVEEMMRSWAHFMTSNDQIVPFGEHLDTINVILRKRYKKYLQAIVKKLVNNTNENRNTNLKMILEATKESESEAEIRERMQPLSLQVSNSIQSLHEVFSTAIFIDMSRDFWDRFGQIVLKFLESEKENGTSYKGSCIALEIIEALFTSEMQRYVGNALQEVDLNPPRSVSDARSILC